MYWGGDSSRGSGIYVPTSGDFIPCIHCKKQNKSFQGFWVIFYMSSWKMRLSKIKLYFRIQYLKIFKRGWFIDKMLKAWKYFCLIVFRKLDDFQGLKVTCKICWEFCKFLLENLNLKQWFIVPKCLKSSGQGVDLKVDPVLKIDATFQFITWSELWMFLFLLF